MVYKVAGEESARLNRDRWLSRIFSDISLAAFGRKEIEIAEVPSNFGSSASCTHTYIAPARDARPHVHEAEGVLVCVVSVMSGQY